MKNLIIFILIFMFYGCNDENQNYINVNGKVVDLENNNGVSNIKIRVTSKRFNKAWGVSSEIENKFTTTDYNGNFNINIKIENAENLVEIYQFGDKKYTDYYRTYYQKEINNLNIEVKKFEVLKIYVKNTNPFDSNDKITVEGMINELLIERKNYGNANEKEEYQTGFYTDVNVWKGININSEISYRVVKYPYILTITTIKNGIINVSYSPPINIIRNQINEYFINY